MAGGFASITFCVYSVVLRRSWWCKWSTLSQSGIVQGGQTRTDYCDHTKLFWQESSWRSEDSENSHQLVPALLASLDVWKGFEPMRSVAQTRQFQWQICKRNSVRLSQLQINLLLCAQSMFQPVSTGLEHKLFTALANRDSRGLVRQLQVLFACTGMPGHFN